MDFDNFRSSERPKLIILKSLIKLQYNYEIDESIMVGFRGLSRYYTRYMEVCRGSRRSFKNLDSMSTMPPHIVIEQIQNGHDTTDVELKYAKHIVVPIYSRIIGASAHESMLEGTKVKTPIAFTKGKNRPRESVLSIDNGFDGSIPIGKRAEIIEDITEQLSNLLGIDTWEPTDSYELKSTLSTGFGVEAYTLERIRISK